MVPEPKRSPVRKDAPLLVRWASIWAGDQYIARYGGRETPVPFTSISTAMSSPAGSAIRRYSSGSGRCPGSGALAVSSAGSGVTQAATLVANDLPRNGPSGTYSHAWMSLADQSFNPTTPKTWSANAEVGTGRPNLLGAPTTNPSSASMSRRREGPKVGASRSGAFRCPAGRRTEVPDATTVPERPWYPTGRYRQFGSSGSASGRKIRPTLLACSSEQ